MRQPLPADKTSTHQADAPRLGLVAVELSEHDLNCAPRSTRELISVVGVSAAIAITNNLGGVWLDVPASRSLNPKPPTERSDHVESLVAQYGAMVVADLAYVYGGSRICIAKADALVRHVRNKQLAAMTAQHYNQCEIAIALHITVRQVARLQAKLKQDEALLDYAPRVRALF